MRAHELLRTKVLPLLRVKMRGGWTADEKLELLRQRWIADASGTTLAASIPGRTAAAAWPQLSKLRKLLGDELFDAGSTARQHGGDVCAQFLSDLNRNSSKRSLEAATEESSRKETKLELASAKDAADQCAAQYAAEVRTQRDAARAERETRQREHDSSCFQASGTFTGARTGWVFKRDTLGLGYYADAPFPERFQVLLTLFPSQRPSFLATALREQDLHVPDTVAAVTAQTGMEPYMLTHVAAQTAARHNRPLRSTWTGAMSKHAEYRLYAHSSGELPPNCQPRRCKHSSRRSGDLLCSSCTSLLTHAWDSNLREPRELCNICGCILHTDGSCSAEAAERQWHELHWYLCKHGGALPPAEPVTSPIPLLWTSYSYHNTWKNSVEDFWAHFVHSEGTPRCRTCGHHKRASESCMFCANQAECMRQEGTNEHEIWCCSDCYACWSPDHRCISAVADARVDQCDFCKVWSTGVFIDTKAGEMLNSKLVFGRQPVDVTYLPRIANAVLNGPRFSRIRWQCTGCKESFLHATELPAKFCGYCDYEACSNCAHAITCSHSECANRRRRHIYQLPMPIPIIEYGKVDSCDDCRE